MIDYGLVIRTNYPGAVFTTDGDEYDGITWLSDSPKPSQAELEAAWPQVHYDQQVAIIEQARRADYEAQSDPLFFEWQRGDGTEQAWLDAVAAVKAAHPYPPAP